eukprot:Gb_12175 [translate_table: standard]
MAGSGENSDESSTLEETPTWAVAVVCLVFVIISLLMEYIIHRVGKKLAKGHKKAMHKAFEKIKEEMMLLGFISLLITIAQKPVSKICIAKSLAHTMLPCKKKYGSDDGESDLDDAEKDGDSSGGKNRKLLWESMSSSQEVPWRRILAIGGGSDHCAKKGMVPLVSQDGIHQLHIFIFVLAVFHVLYSILAMVLGKAKVFDSITLMLLLIFSVHENIFMFLILRCVNGKYGNKRPKLLVINIHKACFFGQFFRSVTKADYLNMRHGFITAHLAPDSKFDFHKYIKQSLEDDFKEVVGISPPLWAFVVVFLLLNVNGWYTYLWLSFVPLILILLIGTKLQIIRAELALEIQERHLVVKGTPVVQPSDKLFWFGYPQLVIYLIHFILFENAFQIAFFLWTWYEFGLRSCFHQHFGGIITILTLGVGVQFLCSYITLPLYALVTQMGSHMKIAIFKEQTTNALKRWHQAARKNQRRQRSSGLSSRSTSGQTTPSQGSSPLHLPYKYKSTGALGSPQISEISYQSEYELSDLEMNLSPPPDYPNSIFTKAEQNQETTGQQTTTKDADTNNPVFSFEKL